jgi:hypothetical protein
MKTSYYKPQQIVSPFQVLEKRAVIEIQDKNHPVAEEVKRNCGTYEFSATFSQDTETLDMFRHIPGLIAFACTLKRGAQIIGYGRGTAVISRVNRFIDRTVRAAFSQSLVDAILKAKLIDALHLVPTQQNGEVKIGEAYRSTEVEVDESISERQMHYLSELISLNVENDADREKWMASLSSMSKADASEAIQSFLPDKE